MNFKRRKEKQLNTVELRDRQLITDFGWMTLAMSVGILIPGIIIWLLFGYDFSFSIEITIGSNGELFRAITTLVILCIGSISAFLFYYFKICKADIFLFSFAFFSVYVGFFYTGKVFIGTGGKEIIFRFLVALAAGTVGTIFGTMISWYAVNREYKAKENLEVMIEKQKTDPESLTQKEINLIKKHEMNNYKAKIKEEHNQKIIEILNEKVQHKIKQEQDLQQKLNEKEEAERQKEKDN